MHCPSCGEDNPDRAKFCLNCGAALSSMAEPAGESRKVVTIVFADMAGSTALGERLDPEALRRVQGRYFDAMAAVIEEHGGTVEKYIGDAVMAVFGIPKLHEDDPLRAVRAAEGMQQALVDLNDELERDHGVRIQIRIGVNTGEVVAGDTGAGQRLVTGDTVNVAARLEQAAHAGQILLGEATQRLVKDAVRVEPVAPLDLKGKTDRVAAHRLLEVLHDTAGHVRNLDSPMVGREKELELFRRALERVMGERTSHLFTLLGPAGVGKSRLVREFLAGVGDATILRGRCLSYGEGITYYPLAEIVRRAGAIDERDDVTVARGKLLDLLQGVENAEQIVASLGGVLGWSEPGGAEDTTWSARRLFEHLAKDRPLVVLIDDLHWAEPLLLDLVEHLADWTRDAELLLVCVARPELLEIRPGWGGGKMNATSILLEPLAGDDAGALLDNLLGASDLPSMARDRILAAAEGNPLFVEEMVGMLIDDGLLRFEDGIWHADDDLADLTVPPTIHLLLAARLDRLDAEERAVIERGAVEGKVFHAGAVTSLTPEGLRAQVRPRLLALARKELIRPDRTEFAGEDAFRFRHLLIRDAAYQAMPKEQRADLHQRFADWLENAAGERTEDYVEILAHHLEQAWRYRSEIGIADQEADALGVRASRALRASADRATARGDLATAGHLLERAMTMGSEPEREAAAIDLVETRFSLGEFSATIELATSLADGTHDPAIALRARIILLLAHGQTDSTLRLDEATTRARAMLSQAHELGDPKLEDRCTMLLGLLAFFSGRSEEHREISMRLLPRAAELTAVHRREIAFGLTASVVWGPTTVEEGGTTPDLVEQLHGDSILGRFRAHMLRGVLNAMSDDEAAFDAAMVEIDAIGQELGAVFANMASQPRIECLGRFGRLEEAVRLGQAGKRAYDGAGETGANSTTTALTARYAAELGWLSEADSLVADAKAMAAPDDFAAHVPIGWSEALLASARGDHEAALVAIDRANALIMQSDYITYQAETARIRGRILRAAGRAREALVSFQDALALYERKGDAASARTLRDEIADSEPA